jgi:tetratricopeptide (TPR) repeat protein
MAAAMAVAVFVVGGTPAFAAAQAAKPAAAPGFDSLVKQAEAAQKAGKSEAALEAYHKALVLRPTALDTRWALASLYYDLGRYKDARTHFRPVVAGQPKNGLAWAMTGLCDARLEEYDAALTELLQAAALGVANTSIRSIAQFQTALLLNRAGNPEGAFETLREFAGQGLDNPSVIVAFGLSLLRLPYLPEEVPANKREMVQLAGRGGFHLARGRRTTIGRLALEELVARYPTEPNVRFAFGSYIAPEEPEAAIAEFEKELERDPDHYPSLLQIAQLLTRLGRPADALPFAEKAVRVAPGIPGARLVLGRALLETGDAVRAVTELEKGAELAPQSADMHFSLARAYQRAGREQEAARAREEFLKLDRASRERRADPGAESAESKGTEPS